MGYRSTVWVFAALALPLGAGCISGKMEGGPGDQSARARSAPTPVCPEDPDRPSADRSCPDYWYRCARDGSPIMASGNIPANKLEGWCNPGPRYPDGRDGWSCEDRLDAHEALVTACTTPGYRDFGGMAGWSCTGAEFARVCTNEHFVCEASRDETSCETMPTYPDQGGQNRWVCGFADGEFDFRRCEGTTALPDDGSWVCDATAADGTTECRRNRPRVFEDGADYTCAGNGVAGQAFNVRCVAADGTRPFTDGGGGGETTCRPTEFGFIVCDTPGASPPAFPDDGGTITCFTHGDLETCTHAPPSGPPPVTPPVTPPPVAPPPAPPPVTPPTGCELRRVDGTVITVPELSVVACDEDAYCSSSISVCVGTVLTPCFEQSGLTNRMADSGAFDTECSCFASFLTSDVVQRCCRDDHEILVNRHGQERHECLLSSEFVARTNASEGDTNGNGVRDGMERIQAEANRVCYHSTDEGVACSPCNPLADYDDVGSFCVSTPQHDSFLAPYCNSGADCPSGFSCQGTSRGFNVCVPPGLDCRPYWDPAI